ncbi:hypothetical protein ACJZ2D_005231 [Fusarium nematophilum]
MAEALGIVAAAAQLLDLSGRILVASSGLVSKLHNVPRQIETLQENVKHFGDLLRLLLDDCESDSSTTPSSVSVACNLSSVLKHAITETRQLAQLLEDLVPKQPNHLRRAWATVVVVQKDREIAERCERLESFKSSLQLWYQYHISVRQETQLLHISSSQLSQHQAVMASLAQHVRVLGLPDSFPPLLIPVPVFSDEIFSAGGVSPTQLHWTRV